MEVQDDLVGFAAAETLREARAQGAAEVLGKLMLVVDNSWNVEGVRRWIEQELEEGDIITVIEQ